MTELRPSEGWQDQLSAVDPPALWDWESGGEVAEEEVQAVRDSLEVLRQVPSQGHSSTVRGKKGLEEMPAGASKVIIVLNTSRWADLHR